MRVITDNIIGTFGQEVDVSFTCNNGTFTNDRITKVRFYYEGELFKSVMSCLEITTEKDELQAVRGNIVSDFTIKYTFEGIENSINYGDFIINNIERDQESGTYTYISYDKMLLSMVTAEISDLEYPLTLKNFTKAICQKIGYSFDLRRKMVNGDMMVTADYYSDGFNTYRDILDDIAQASASIIKVNNDMSLSLVYLNDTHVILTEDNLSQLDIAEKFGKVNTITLGREPADDDVFAQDTASVTANGLYEVKFNNNQIMDSEDDVIRLQFAQNILNETDGMEFYEYELSSYGIGIFEVGDCFTLKVASSHLAEDEESGNVTFINYPCVWLKSDIEIAEGIIEKSSFVKPVQSVTDYGITSSDMNVLKQAYIKVNKLEGQITLVAEEIKAEVIKEGKGSHLEQTINGINIHSIVKLDENGDPIYSGGYSNINEKGMSVYDENGDELLVAQGKVVKTGTFQTGNWRMEQSSESNGSTLDFFFVED